MTTKPIATFPIKILAQVSDNEPIEIGVYEIPIYAGEPKPDISGNVHFELTAGSIDPHVVAKALSRLEGITL